MIKITGSFSFDKRKLLAFSKKMEGLPAAVQTNNNRILNTMRNQIIQKLRDDERPSQSNPRWIGHDYTGTLISSVKVFSRVNDRGDKKTVESKIGYFVKHGTNLEPPATVEGNIFVPQGWTKDWKATLQGRTASRDAVGLYPKDLSFTKLFDWAVDLLTRRDLDRGKKSNDPKNIRRRARRLARKYLESLQGGTPGYPIIIPIFEKFVQKGYVDSIIRGIQRELNLDLPF